MAILTLLIPLILRLAFLLSLRRDHRAAKTPEQHIAVGSLRGEFSPRIVRRFVVSVDGVDLILQKTQHDGVLVLLASHRRRYPTQKRGQEHYAKQCPARFRVMDEL